MWGTQGWNQWALQPSMFNDVPHEQIDWAALAKQWIQMQQTPAEAPPPGIPPLPAATLPAPAAAIIAPPPPGHLALNTEELPDENKNALLLKPPLTGGLPEAFHSERKFEGETGPFLPKNVDNMFWNKNQWEPNPPADVDERLWPGPPVEPIAPSLLGGKETFDYGHMHDNPPLAMQSIDYNHMSDYSYNQVPVYPPENQYEQYWSQVNAAPPTLSPMFLKKERTNANLPVEEDTSQIDAAKRKQLPAWIRDGLEKMEQERLKRLERERTAKEKAEKISKTDLFKKELDSKSDSLIIMPSKSKFESDSEAECEENEPEVRLSPVQKRIPSPIEDTRTEDEKKQDLILKVRRMLTEILLSVTNSEMRSIAQEVYRKAVSKAPARQLASSTSLTSVASGLRGLASYGTESEASEPEEENEATDSDEELYRKMKEKKKLFALKEKKIIAELEKQENDERNEHSRTKNGKSEQNSSDLERTTKVPLDSEKLYSCEVESKECIIPFLGPTPQLALNEIPFIKDTPDEDETESKQEKNVENIESENTKKHDESVHSSDSSSSSSDSESDESSRKKRKRESSRKSSKKDKSPSKHTSRHKRGRSKDSDSSERHKRSRPQEKSKSSTSKKKKKYKERDSSTSSGSSSRKRRRSSKYESNHNHRERSHSYDDDRYRKRRHSRSSSKSHHKKDSHSSRSSHRHEEREKHDRKYKDDRRYKEHRRTPSPHHSSKIPKKYRSSRSLSSESESSGKKLKKSRNR